MEKSKRKGFTLVEVLGVVIVLGILVVIAVPMVSNYLKQGKDDYNEKLKSQLLLSGKEYYSSHTQKLPIKIGDVYRNDKDYSVVTLPEIQGENLVSKDFIDSEGRGCKESYVYVRQNENGKEYNYHACLICTGKNGEEINYSENDLVCLGQNWDNNVGPRCSVSTYSGGTSKGGKEFNPTSVTLNTTSKNITGFVINEMKKGREYQTILDKEQITGINVIDKLNINVKEEEKDGEYTVKLVGDNGKYSNECASFVIDNEKPKCNLKQEVKNNQRVITLTTSDNYSDQNNVNKVISRDSNLNNESIEGGIGDSIITESINKNMTGIYYGYVKDEAGNTGKCSVELGETPVCRIINDTNDTKWYSVNGYDTSKTLNVECSNVYNADKITLDENKITVNNTSLGTTTIDNKKPDAANNKINFNIVFKPKENVTGKTTITIAEGFIANDDKYKSRKIDSNSINVDSIKPEIAVSSSNTGWTNKDVTVTATATDKGTKVSEIIYYENSTKGKGTRLGSLENPAISPLKRTKKYTKTGTTTMYVQAVDAAGNKSNVKSTTVKIDKVKPTITYKVNKKKTEDGWYKTSSSEPFKVTISCTDNNSGVNTFKINDKKYSSNSKTMSRTSAARPKTYSTSCTDKAGNTASGSKNYYVRVYGNCTCKTWNYVTKYSYAFVYSHSYCAESNLYEMGPSKCSSSYYGRMKCRCPKNKNKCTKKKQPYYCKCQTCGRTSYTYKTTCKTYNKCWHY